MKACVFSFELSAVLFDFNQMRSCWKILGTILNTKLYENPFG